MASGAAKNLAIRYLPFAIRLSRLHPVVALDHDDVGDRPALALRLGGFVLGRVPAGERRLVGGKLDHNVAAARLALDGLVLAATHEEAYVDMGDPIALRHDSGPLDRDDVGAAGALALLLRRLVFGRVVVALRLLERFELDDDVARPRLALELLDRAAAHERLAAVFADRLGGVLHVLGVLLGVRHDDAGDDVAFEHGASST